MRRLFKKYNLLFWLALLLLAGLAFSSAVLLTMSRDMLQQQTVRNILPLTGDNLYSNLQLEFARAEALSARLPDDSFLRDWIEGDTQDSAALIAQLKASKQKDKSILHFVVTERDQRYIDSLGTVRAINPDDYRDTWYPKSRDSTRPVTLYIESDPGSDNRPLIYVSYRLFDADHQFIGVVGLVVPLAALPSPGDDGTRSIYFVDRSGKIVLSNSNQLGNIRRQDGIKSIADAMLADQQHAQNFSYEQDGVKIFVNARFLPELNWYLIVEDNAQSITQAAWPLTVTNAVIGLIVCVAALILAWFSIAHHQSRMRALASRDSMTGLMNRQSFTNTFQQVVLEMQRLKLPLSFILFDIDYLKKINESLGHATGDRIIMDIAQLSKRSVRGSDLLCRWGGEQFAILLKRCDLEQAYKVAEQLRLNVQNHAFAFDDREASVTISLGVAELTENETIDELFARVDEAVYLAKSEGRNRAEISYYINA